MSGRQLARSTVEAWAGTGITMLVAAIPMTWSMECVLLVLVFGLFTDIILHAGFTAKAPLPLRICLCLWLLIILSTANRDSIVQRYMVQGYMEQERPAELPLPLLEASIAVDFVEQSWVLATLSLATIIAAFWRYPVIWRLRHRTLFRLRKSIMDEVWLTKSSALELISKSRWGESRRWRGEGVNLSEFLTSVGMVKPQAARRTTKFQRWCEMALERFEGEKGTYRDDQANGRMYEEGSLRSWLQSRYDKDVTGEFGEP